MRILIFYQYFGTPKGSWSTRFYEFSKRWVEAGHQVTVVTAPYEKSDIVATKFIERQVIEGINLIVINAPDSNRASVLKRGLNAVMFSLTASWFAITQKADVVISSSGPITIGIPGLVGKIFGKKFVFEVRDLWPEGAVQIGLIKNKVIIKLSYWFEKVCYFSASLIVTCSSGMTDNLKKRFPNINLLTIPNASDTKLFSTIDSSFSLPEWARGKIIFLYTGSIGLMDDAMQIMKAIEKIKNPDIIFVFIGDGKEKSILMDYADSINKNNIFFLGLIPKTQVVSWLQNAYMAFVTFKDIEVLNTCSPNKLFDAFAAGVPVIQNTQGWIKELIDRENCGINVSPNNPDEFAAAIDTATMNKSLRDLQAGNAIRLAKDLFNRELLALQYLEGLKKI